MANQIVATASKPHAIDALRKTWRRSTEHFMEQVSRFFRLTILAAVPSAYSLLAGGHFDYKTLLAFIIPFAEVAFRQVFPAMGAAAADSAPGVTIVPSQVGVADQPPGTYVDPNVSAGVVVDTTPTGDGPPVVAPPVVVNAPVVVPAVPDASTVPTVAPVAMPVIPATGASDAAP